MSDMPMLEPCSVAETYELTKFAFELSEQIGGPVFVRLVTNNSQSHACIEIEERILPPESQPLPVRDTAKFTKAGAAICMTQHRDLIARLAKAEEIIAQQNRNRMRLGRKDGVGIISVGITNGYQNEALESLSESGVDVSEISSLELIASIPFAKEKIETMIFHCSTLLIAEELEGHIEKYVYMQAYKMGKQVKILGKEDGTYERIGEYDAQILRKGVCKALGIALPECFADFKAAPEDNCTKRPIGFCAGCPHRGTYMGIEAGLKKAGLKKKDVLITGDIGCTILGISPPFEILWTELAMGASIPLAQGFAYSNIPSPIIATIGDSTFFHSGIPGLVDIVHSQADVCACILDNSATAMTGHQEHPGTEKNLMGDAVPAMQIEAIVRALGLPDAHIRIADPVDQKAMQEAIDAACAVKGPFVIIARRPCALLKSFIRANAGKHCVVDRDKCKGCKLCTKMACPALALVDGKAEITDTAACTGCGLCMQICRFGAIRKVGE